MASTPPLRSPFTREQVVHAFKVCAGPIAISILSAALATVFTYLMTAKLNNEAALQQQYLVAVQDFNATGARVDAAITELSDNVIDSTEVKQARREARQAIAAHVAATQALSPLMGKGNVSAYMEGLASLRAMVDRTGNVSDALRTSRARFDLMENRQVMLNEARRRIYGKP